MSTLYLYRGAPGSGKSTHAKQLVKDLGGCLHLEADMLCMIDGNYKWDKDTHSKKHQTLQEIANAAMSCGGDVVVSNTFTKTWEVEPYLKMADEHSYHVHVIHMTGTYDSIHGVPDEVVERMRNDYEPLPDEIDV